MGNGTARTAQAPNAGAHAHDVELRFSRPGAPTDDPFIESLGDKFRDERLNRHWFGGLSDARFAIENWTIDYNRNRPHSSLGTLPPCEFAAQASAGLRSAEARRARDASTLGFVGPANGGLATRNKEAGSRSQ